MKKTLLAAVAATATLAVSGCGNATHISADGAHLSKATFADAMSKATSQIRSEHMTMKVSAAGQTISMSADIAISNATALHMPLSQALQHMAMSMHATFGGKAFQMRLVDGTVYVEANGLGMGTNPAKPWTKVQVNDAHNPFTRVFANMTGFDPSQISKAFRGISTFTKVGAATVDGISVTHYRVSLDAAKAAGLLGGAGGSALSTLPKTLTYDVWVDSQARPVEVSAKVSWISMEMHFSRWNAPVHIVAPPASKVTTATH